MKVVLAIVVVLGVGLGLFFALREDAAPAGGRPGEVEAPERVGAGQAAAAAETATTPAPQVPSRVPVAGTTVSGTVYGPEGEPEADVRVDLQRLLSAWPDRRTAPLGSVLTGADGRFRFGAAVEGGLRIVATKTGLARTEIAMSEHDRDTVVRMEYGFHFDGVVESQRGQLMADCLVILEPTAASVERAVSTRTDRQGRFAFEDMRAGAWRLTARHPAYRPVSRQVVVGGQTGTHLRFSQPGLSVTGTIAAAGNGLPVTGAVVRGYPNAWNGRLFLPFEARSDAQGEFQLPGMDPGNLRLEFRHPDHSTYSRLVSVGQESLTLSVELALRCVVRGRLVGDVEVPAGLELQFKQEGDVPIRVPVAADGRFELPDRVSVGSAELGLFGEALCFAQSGSRTVTVEVPEAETTDLEIAVAAASTTQGLVTDAGGAPLAGVRVLWRRPNLGLLAPLQLLTATGADGRYSIRGLPRALVLPGLVSTARVVFERFGYATEEVPFPGVGPGESIELDTVTLQRSGRIEGRVVRNGKGEIGAIVFTGNAMTSMRKAVTGPDGRFILRDLPPASHRLKVSYSAQPLWVSDSEYELEAGGVLSGVDLALPSGRVVNGRVVARGKPVPYALIVARGMRGAAYNGDANGAFQIILPHEDVELEVFANVALHDFSVRRTVPVPANQDKIEVELPLVPYGEVIGRVHALHDGAPVTGGILRIEALDAVDGEMAERQRNVRARYVEIPVGELRLEQFPAGRSRMTLHCEGYRPVVQELELAAGGTFDLGPLQLERGASIRGRVVNATGEPVPDARAYLGLEIDAVPPRSMRADSFTGGDGVFELSGVGPSSTTLVVKAQGYAPEVRELVLPDDVLRVEPLELVLRPGGTIAVTLDGGGGDGEFYMVVLEKGGELVDLRVPDHEGSVLFENRSLGRYTVRVLGGGDAVPVVLDEEGQRREVAVTTQRR